MQRPWWFRDKHSGEGVEFSLWFLGHQEAEGRNLFYCLTSAENMVVSGVAAFSMWSITAASNVARKCPFKCRRCSSSFRLNMVSQMPKDHQSAPQMAQFCSEVWLGLSAVDSRTGNSDACGMNKSKTGKKWPRASLSLATPTNNFISYLILNAKLIFAKYIPPL